MAAVPHASVRIKGLPCYCPAMGSEPEFSSADLAYVRAEYRTAAELCSGRRETPDWLGGAIDRGKLPHPAYVLPDGAQMFPPDFFVLPDHAGDVDDLPSYFRGRYVIAAQAAGLDGSDAEETWAGYLSGQFGICLRNVTPESMVKKTQLIDVIEHLVAVPAPGDPAWQTALRSSVDALDDLERPFTDYDRSRWGETSRDRHVTAVRTRYPQVFAAGCAVR